MDFLNNIVPDGYIVVARGNVPSTTPIPAAYADVWRGDTTIYGSGNSLYHVFKNQGIADVDSFNRPRTFIFIYKKNGQGSLAPSYTLTETVYDNLAQTVNIKTSDTLGFVESPLYGKAKQWHTIKINGSALPDLPGADSARLNLIGVNLEGQ